MADLPVTAASCVPGANAVLEYGVAGETITAGQAVYLDEASTGKYLKADADSATAAARTARGIAVNGASLNQPLTIQKSGLITLGATLTANTPYYLSGLAAGGICPIADVGAGEYLCQIGIARTTAVLNIDIQATGVSN